MKIGIYNPYMDDLGGGEKYMMSIAEYLSKEHEVSVFWDSEKDIKEFLERFSIDLSRVKFVKNIFSKDVTIWKRLLISRGFDIIIILSDGSIPFLLCHKLFLHFQQPMEHLGKLSLWKKLKLTRVTDIFCNSYFIKSFIDKKFGKNTKVIYPPVDIYAKKIRKENIILNVGRLRVRDVVVGRPINDYKKQTVLIKAFKQLLKKGLCGWKLVLAVSVKDQDKNVLERMKKGTEGLPIQFVVNQNNRQLWNYYNLAKIYWHASGFGEDLIKHPEYAEHFGISTVEAMGAGAVPIVINAGGQKEIVKDKKNGLLWNTLRELQDKTLWVIREKRIWQRLSVSAKSLSITYSKENFYENVDEIIKN